MDCYGCSPHDHVQSWRQIQLAPVTAVAAVDLSCTSALPDSSHMTIFKELLMQEAHGLNLTSAKLNRSRSRLPHTVKHIPAHVYLEYPTQTGLHKWKQQSAKSREEAAFRLGYMAAKFHSVTAHLDNIYLIYCDNDGTVFQLDPIAISWQRVHYDPQVEKRGLYTFS